MVIGSKGSDHTVLKTLILDLSHENCVTNPFSRGNYYPMGYANDKIEPCHEISNNVAF